MNSETVVEVAKTLIGITFPVGDFQKDSFALDNQDKLIELTKCCVNMLISNSSYKDREEYYAEKIGVKAQETLQELYNSIGEYI